MLENRVPVYIDIETIANSHPTYREKIEAEIRSGKFVPSNYKKQETIDKHVDAQLKNIQERVDKSALDAEEGSIFCICAAADDGPVNIFAAYQYSETNMLRSFCEWCAKAANRSPILWVVHNALFDLPFLWKRNVINDVSNPWIKPPYQQYKNMFCTMQAWSNERHKGPSLERLAKVLKIQFPEDNIKGDQVQGCYRIGKFQEIIDHCKEDVRVLRQIAGRLGV